MSDITFEMAVPFSKGSTFNVWWAAGAFAVGVVAGSSVLEAINNYALKSLGTPGKMKDVRREAKEVRMAQRETKRLGGDA